MIRNVDTYGYALVEFRKSGSFVDVSGTEFDSNVEVAGASWIFRQGARNGWCLGIRGEPVRGTAYLGVHWI